jgi:hypothetical protein
MLTHHLKAGKKQQQQTARQVSSISHFGAAIM